MRVYKNVPSTSISLIFCSSLSCSSSYKRTMLSPIHIHIHKNTNKRTYKYEQNQTYSINPPQRPCLPRIPRHSTPHPRRTLLPSHPPYLYPRKPTSPPSEPVMTPESSCWKASSRYCLHHRTRTYQRSVSCFFSLSFPFLPI